MSETILVTAVAVGGTIFGAAVSPILGLVGDVVTSKSTAKSDRLKAAASFGELLIKWAGIVEQKDGSRAAITTRALAIEKRFDLAQHLPRKSGQVDRFAEQTIAEMDGSDDVDKRRVAAEYAASQLLGWARGDLKPSNLVLFKVVPHEKKWFIMRSEPAGSEQVISTAVAFRELD